MQTEKILWQYLQEKKAAFLGKTTFHNAILNRRQL